MEKGNKVASAMLREYPDLKALLCGNDNMALGAVAAVKTAGKTGKVLVVGYDNINAVKPLLKEGKLLATADQYAAKQAVFGIETALKALKAKGLPMAVITNKPEAFTLPLLELSGLAGYFDVVVGGDRLPKVKPDPMALIWACGRLGVVPGKTVFIGDSVNDFLAGRAAGCQVFLLPYGYNEGRDVQELDCDAIVPTVDFAAQRLRNSSRPA